MTMKNECFSMAMAGMSLPAITSLGTRVAAPVSVLSAGCPFSACSYDGSPALPNSLAGFCGAATLSQSAGKRSNSAILAQERHQRARPPEICYNFES